MAKEPPRKDRAALRELRALFPRAAAEAGDKRGATAAGFGVAERELRRNASEPSAPGRDAAPARLLQRHASAPGLPPAPEGSNRALARRAGREL